MFLNSEMYSIKIRGKLHQSAMRLLLRNYSHSLYLQECVKAPYKEVDYKIPDNKSN